MGLNIFNVKEDPAHPSPPEIYNWRIYVLTICAAFGSAMFGYDSAFIGGTLNLPSFQQVFGFSGASSSQLAALQANIISTFQAGCFFGAILIFFINENYGRRISLLLAGCVFNVGVILQLCAKENIGMLYAGRLLSGLGVGSSSLVIPQYISECSPPAIRGGLIGLFEIALQIGTIGGFWVNYGVLQNIPSTTKQWQIPVAVQLIPATAMIIGMSFMIESPRWLAVKQKETQALKNLTWLRNLPAEHPYVQKEMDGFRNALEHEMQISSGSGFFALLKESFSKQIRFRILLGCSMMMIQQLTGINAINYFSPSIFQSIGIKGTSVGLLATGVYGIVKTICASFSFLVLVDRFGRRPLLLINSCVVVFTLIYLGSYAAITKSFEGKSTGGAAGNSAIAMIYLYAVFYSSSWNLPWIICAEIFPTRIRSFCLIFTTCAQWLGQFIIVYSTPYMIANITFGTFFFFAAGTSVGIVFIFFCLPETKGIPLEDMDTLFESRGTARSQRKQYLAIKAARDESLIAEKDDQTVEQVVEHIEAKV